MAYETILVERAGGIATVTLNRAEQLNPVDESLISDLVSAFEDLRADDSVRVIILTAAGRVFSAGGDVRKLSERNSATPAHATARYLRDGVHRLPVAMRKVGKPVIAAVNGVATGAGCDLTLQCDIRIASEEASFAESYVNVGLVTGAGGVYLLPRLVGLGKACELIFTGELIDAREAERIGLVNKVVRADELMPAAREMAAKIASKPPLSVRHLKNAIYVGQDSTLEATLEHIALAFAMLSKTEDNQEAMLAFLEKRAPQFKGN